MTGMIGRAAEWGKAAAPALAVALAVAAPGTARAQGDTAIYVARDFRASTGAVAEARLAYRTLGHLRRAPGGRARNAVLVLGGAGATGALDASLFGPGDPLDSGTTFVILPDTTARGLAPPGLGDDDLVDLQHRLVTEGLRVDHLVLVTGTSAGCRQSRRWAARWPAMMDASLPVRCDAERGSGTGTSVADWRAEVADLLARTRTERIE